MGMHLTGMSGDAGKKVISSRAAVWRKILTDLAVMTVIGVFLAILGPFGSIAQPLPVRLLSWLAFGYAGYAIYSPMGILVERAHRTLDLPKPGLWLAAVAIATVPMTVLVIFMQFVPNWPPVMSIQAAMTSYFYVFVVGGGVTLLFHVLKFRSDPGALSQEPADLRPDSPSPETENPLLARLPPALGSDIIALEMEDHYVRVHTALGSELVLMRMRDAAEHLSEWDGRQVHRSWWVARGAVEDVIREGRNVRLLLGRGIEAPVSRAQVSELKQAGWL